MLRKIVQICSINNFAKIGEVVSEKSTLVALCDDGSLWEQNINENQWKPIAAIPQGITAGKLEKPFVPESPRGMPWDS